MAEIWYGAFKFNDATNTITSYDAAVGGLNPSIPSTLGGFTVQHIGSYAFYQRNLTGVTLPSTILTIQGQAFALNSSIASINLPSGLTSIGDGAFQSCTIGGSLTIGSSVTYIGYRAFYNCPITSLSLGNSVSVIGYEAFTGHRLSSLTIPASITSIGSAAFSPNASANLTSLTLNNPASGNATMDTMAFAYNKLTSVTVPVGYVSVGASAFLGNPLATVSVSSANIGAEAFKGVGGVSPASKITSLTLGAGVVTIGENAFLFHGLTSLTIPNTVTTIGAYAFSSREDYPRIASLSLGSSVATIGNGAFNSSNITSIIFPASLTSLGLGCFSNTTTTITSVRIGNNVNIAPYVYGGDMLNMDFKTFYDTNNKKAGQYTYNTSLGTWSGLFRPDEPVLSLSSVTLNTINLSWTTPAGATPITYAIFKDGVAYTTNVNISGNTATLSGLASNTFYNNLSVRASNTYGSSLDSNLISPLTLPAAPTSLSYTPSSNTFGTLSWTAPSGDGNVTYNIFRAEELHTTSSTTSKGVGTTPNVTFTFKVQSVNSSGVSPTFSNTVSYLPVPNAPFNLRKTASTGTTITIAWDPPTSGASYYIVYNAADHAAFPLTYATSYQINNLTINSSYSFYVKAFNTTGGSSPSATLNTSTSSYLTTPSNLTGSLHSTTGFTLSWNAVSGATSYEIYGAGSTRTSGTNSIAITGLTANTSYSMSVKALSVDNYSNISGAVNIYTKCNAPTNLQSLGQTTNTATIRWSDPANGAGSYKVKVNGVEQTVTITPA